MANKAASIRPCLQKQFEITVNDVVLLAANNTVASELCDARVIGGGAGRPVYIIHNSSLFS